MRRAITIFFTVAISIVATKAQLSSVGIPAEGYIAVALEKPEFDGRYFEFSNGTAFLSVQGMFKLRNQIITYDLPFVRAGIEWSHLSPYYTQISQFPQTAPGNPYFGIIRAYGDSSLFIEAGVRWTLSMERKKWTTFAGNIGAIDFAERYDPDVLLVPLNINFVVPLPGSIRISGKLGLISVLERDWIYGGAAEFTPGKFRLFVDYLWKRQHDRRYRFNRYLFHDQRISILAGVDIGRYVTQVGVKMPLNSPPFSFIERVYSAQLSILL